MVPWAKDHCLGQFWKLGFFSVSECEIFAHGGQLHILLDRECVARFPTWNMPKNTFMTPQNPILMQNYLSMPRVGIQQVSLKACRRWDSTCHRLMTIARINEPSALLDSGHWDSATRGILMWVHGQGIIFLVNFGN